MMSCSTSDHDSDKEEIIAVLTKQEQAWSQNDINSFMEGYWKSDSLKYYGSSGLTMGWQNMMDNYKRRYPSKEHTGKLNFKIDAINQVDDKSYYVMGQFHLIRELGDANGVFLIIFRKINGEWKIIADLSC